MVPPAQYTVRVVSKLGEMGELGFLHGKSAMALPGLGSGRLAVDGKIAEIDKAFAELQQKLSDPLQNRTCVSLCEGRGAYKWPGLASLATIRFRSKGICERRGAGGRIAPRIYPREERSRVNKNASRCRTGELLHIVFPCLATLPAHNF